MKLLILLLLASNFLFAINPIFINQNEYKIVPIEHKIKKIYVGDKELLSVESLPIKDKKKSLLKFFGKEKGSSSILIAFENGVTEVVSVAVTQTVAPIERSVQIIEPNINLQKQTDGRLLITGQFRDAKRKKRVFSILSNAGYDANGSLDLTETLRPPVLIRTKMYVIEINNQRAKDFSGLMGLSYIDQGWNAVINGTQNSGLSFSGFLLDNLGQRTSLSGSSISGGLKFLVNNGIAQILDDTILTTKEDLNATFHSGGNVIIPVGISRQDGETMIQTEEKEIGIKLRYTASTIKNEQYIDININVETSEFDENKDHWVPIGYQSSGEPIAIPAFVSKSINTSVIVKSGEVISLGGRIKSTKSKSSSKIPLLGDIPIFGHLFRTNLESNNDVDLLFFLIPEIVKVD